MEKHKHSLRRKLKRKLDTTRGKVSKHKREEKADKKFFSERMEKNLCIRCGENLCKCNNLYVNPMDESLLKERKIIAYNNFYFSTD